MRQFFLLSLITFCVFHHTMFAQDKLDQQYPQVYATSGFEIIFSGSTVKNNGESYNSIIRFAPVVNFQSMVNYDVNSKFGLFTGLGIRNVGLIYDEPGNGVRKKHRTYNLAVPVGFKIGNMNKALIYAGYEVELPFHYKEKTFVNEVKSKFTVFFSKRVSTIAHGPLLGIQLPYGLSFKFKYYLNNFFNQSFTTQDPDTGEFSMPYQNLEANIFTLSMNFSLFRNLDLYYEEN